MTVFDGLTEVLELRVATDHLQDIIREDDVVAVGDVQSATATQDAAH